MLFQNTWKSVLDGSKTQTRYPVQAGDAAEFDESGTLIRATRQAEHGPPKVLFEVGKSYPVQPGVGKKTAGRITVTAIRQEPLQAISATDLLKELPSAPEDDADMALTTFQAHWDSQHPNHLWQNNPEVWVVEFKLPFG
jgi:hypothetical protein